jgi:transcriptional regulator with XRE-family HTH domain
MKAWLDKNPLKRWIDQDPRRQAQVAEACEQKPQQIRHWMEGRTSPQPKHLRRLAKIMEIPYARVKELWRDWLSGRPASWIDLNPLKLWIERYPQRRRVRDIALACGRSRGQVYYWIEGHTYPKEEHMRKLAEIMNVPYASLELRWRRWWLKRPQEGEE